MILADTSVWIEHLRNGDPRLGQLLVDGEILCHPFVIGELACGSLSKREEILSLLGTLPTARVAEHAEVLHLVAADRLSARGLGWIDVHLLASAMLSRSSLWTGDKALHRVALAMGVAAH